MINGRTLMLYVVELGYFNVNGVVKSFTTTKLVTSLPGQCPCNAVHCVTPSTALTKVKPQRGSRFNLHPGILITPVL